MLIKMVGIILILGGTISFALSTKTKMLLRVKSLEQIIFAIEICEREIKYNFIKIPDLILKLSKEIQNPIGRVFKKMYKLISISDGLSPEYKWSKTFIEYGEFLNLEKCDLDVLKNMSTVLGKYDIDEQINSFGYYKNLTFQNLNEAKNRLKNEGNIINSVAISLGLLIVIILI